MHRRDECPLWLETSRDSRIAELVPELDLSGVNDAGPGPFVEPPDGEKEDPFKVNLHRVCGFFLGCGTGAWFALNEGEAQSGRELLAFALVGGSVCAWLAGRWLDQFWNWFLSR